MAKRHTVTIEIFGGWVVAYQDMNAFSVLQRGGVESHHYLSLPDSTLCREKLSGLSVQGKRCVLVLSRSYWRLLIEKHTGLTTRELQFATELTKQTICEDVIEEFVVIQSMNVAANNGKEAFVFSAALPLTQVEDLERWVRSLGLELDEIRVSSFHLAKKYTSDVLCIVLYPDSWEVHLIQDGILQNTFSSNVLTANELAKVLTLMSLDHLTNGKAHSWLDIPEQIELMHTNFEGELHVYGQPSDILEMGITSWKEIMEAYGVSLGLTRHNFPGDIGSPSLGLISWPAWNRMIGKKKSGTKYPSLRAKLLRENKVGYHFTWLQTAIALTLVISLGLLGWVQWNQYKIKGLHNQETKAHELLSERVILEKQISELTQKVMYAQEFLENGTAQYDNLVHLMGILPPSTIIERATFSEETMDLVLISNLISEALIALERSAWFSSVDILSPIVQEDMSGHAIERVSLRISYVEGERF